MTRLPFPMNLTLLGFAFFLLNILTVSAQVGINTTNPAAGSILDVNSAEKGILIPRVNIEDLSTIAPITGGSTESLLVYNTNTTTGPGFYYWTGTYWASLDSSKIMFENTSFLDTPASIGTSNGDTAYGLLYTYTFTLDTPRLVEVKYHFDTLVFNYSGSSTTDGRPRGFGTLLVYGGDFFTGTPLVFDSKSYTNHTTTGTVLTGEFSLGGVGFAQFPAGTHTLNLYVFGGGGKGTNPSNTEGFRLIFYNGFDARFQVITHN